MPEACPYRPTTFKSGHMPEACPYRPTYGIDDIPDAF